MNINNIDANKTTKTNLNTTETMNEKVKKPITHLIEKQLTETQRTDKECNKKLMKCQLKRTRKKRTYYK